MYVIALLHRCECVACTQNWGTTPEQQRPLTLKCPQCQSPLPTPNLPISTALNKKTRKAGPAFRCNNCSHPVNIERVMTEMVEAKKCKWLIINVVYIVQAGKFNYLWYLSYIKFLMILKASHLRYKPLINLGYIKVQNYKIYNNLQLDARSCQISASRTFYHNLWLNLES